MLLYKLLQLFYVKIETQSVVKHCVFFHAFFFFTSAFLAKSMCNDNLVIWHKKHLVPFATPHKVVDFCNHLLGLTTSSELVVQDKAQLLRVVNSSLCQRFHFGTSFFFNVTKQFHLFNFQRRDTAIGWYLLYVNRSPLSFPYPNKQTL